MHLFGGWQYHILIRSLTQLLYMLPQTLPTLLSKHRIGKPVKACCKSKLGMDYSHLSGHLRSGLEPVPSGSYIHR